MHYYQFHIGDYRAGTIHLTQIERWVYRDLLDCLYDTEEPLPLDVNKVCMMVGARSDEHKEAVRVVLETKFVQTDQGYTNSRFESELDKYRSKAQRAIDANKKRWGYEKDLKSDVKSDANQIPTNNHKPITNKKESLQPIEGLDVDAWERWLDYRKEIKKPIKVASMQSAMKAFVKHGSNQAQVVEQSIANGWTGLFELKDQSAQLKHTKPFDVWDQPYIPLSQR